ncbi:MAG: hypothetical protein HYU74_00115 [Dechloromonas sp.]|nr:hypothetical protein [Dechloromonas sp.]
MSEQFVLQPFEIEGQRLEFTIPYAAPHSELLTAIVARQDIEDDPTEALKEGLVLSFENLRKQLQPIFLMGSHETQEMMLTVVDGYLEQYPDERVSDFVDFVRKNRPVANAAYAVPREKQRAQAVKDKKHKEKMKEKSRRRNRK